MSLLGYPKVIPYTKFENYGIIVFTCVSHADARQVQAFCLSVTRW